MLCRIKDRVRVNKVKMVNSRVKDKAKVRKVMVKVNKDRVKVLVLVEVDHRRCKIIKMVISRLFRI